MQILPREMHYCEIFVLTSDLAITADAPQVPLLQLCQGRCSVPNCCFLICGHNRGRVALPTMMLISMIMMTYLSQYSISARSRGTQRRIPPDDEFIRAGDEMSCLGRGYGGDLCSLRHSVRSGSRSSGPVRRKSRCFSGTRLSLSLPPSC